MSHHISRRKTLTIAIALSLGVAGTMTAGAAASAAPAPAATTHSANLVSAAGNVIAPSSGRSIQPAAVYYWGWYSTKAKCQAALKAKLATGQFNFGGCNYYNQSPHYNTWQLWLDETDCTDRVAPTSIQAASSRPLSLSALAA